MQRNTLEFEFALMMFHDFIIDEIIPSTNSTVVMRIKLPYEIEGIDHQFHTFNYFFKNFSLQYCEYYPCMNSNDKLQSKTLYTTDINLISKLKLEVQSFEMDEKQIRFNCNGSKNIEGGKLFFNSDQLTITNERNEELSPQVLEQLFNKHWNE